MIKDFPSPDRKKRVTREQERLVRILLVIGHHPLGLPIRKSRKSVVDVTRVV